MFAKNLLNFATENWQLQEIDSIFVCAKLSVSRFGCNRWRIHERGEGGHEWSMTIPGQTKLKSFCSIKTLFYSICRFHNLWSSINIIGPRTSAPLVKVNRHLYEALSLTASTLLHRLVLLSVRFVNPKSGRYSTNWDRKGWPGSYIQMFYGCISFMSSPCVQWS